MCHDPLEALDGGEDGLECYRKYPRQFLSKGSVFAVEIGAYQLEAVTDLLKEDKTVLHVQPDIQKIDRVVVFKC